MGFSFQNRMGIEAKAEAKRTILYDALMAHLVSFALGEKPSKQHESGLPSHVIAVIDGAKRYAEGRGLRFEIKSQEDLFCVLKIADAKMKN
jgi:hypothetical protein